MKAQELRIGNYYQYAGNSGIVYAQVQAIKSNQFGLLSDFNGTNFENCKPIELTEEWLSNFGFKAENTYSNFTLNEIEIASSVRVITTNERTSFYLDGEIPDFMKIKIQHVHQLQNLFFCLCGEELEIKR